MTREVEQRAGQLAADAGRLQAAAIARGASLSTIDAVRQAKGEVPSTAGDEIAEQAERLRFQANQRGEVLDAARAHYFARNPQDLEAIAMRARQELFEARERGFPVDTLQALERAKSYCAGRAAFLARQSKR